MLTKRDKTRFGLNNSPAVNIDACRNGGAWKISSFQNTRIK